MYIDIENQSSTILGTEYSWLAYSIGKDLHNHIAPRLRPFYNEWDKKQLYTQVYSKFMFEYPLSKSRFKTDLCVEENGNFHLLEIGHYEPLNSNLISDIETCLEFFRSKLNSFQQKHPNVIFPLTCVEQIHDYQALYTEENEMLERKAYLETQLELREPISEPTLTKLEEEALKLRVTWHTDDEIAERMGLGILGVQHIFHNIQDKYQQPKIPHQVYVSKIKQVLQQINYHGAL